MKEIFQRTFTGISLVVVFLGSMLLGPLPFLAVLILVYVIGSLELMKLQQDHNPLSSWLFILSGIFLLLVVAAGLLFQLHPLFILLPLLLWLTACLMVKDLSFGGLILFWLSIPFASYFALGWLTGAATYNPLIPLLVITLVWINDIFAYLTGSLVGRHPMTPRLSPGKTWEGFAGSFLANLLAAWVIFKLTKLFSAPAWVLTGAAISILALAGDLFESALKRKHGVKDSGKLLPGHGGILDRFDSLLFVAPVVFIILIISILLS